MPAPAMVLTQSDVESLLRNDSANSRVNVLEKVAAHYNSSELHDRELIVAEQIFRLLMKDAEMFVRTALADRLKDNPTVPRDIILHLANEHVDAAAPVLSCSQVLSDADLIQIIESTRELGKLQSIAKRPSVSSRVSGALIETSYPTVITELLTNAKADITPSMLEQVAKDFGNDEPVMMAMVTRPPLPAPLVDKLMKQASANVAKELKKRYAGAAKLVEKESNVIQEDTLMQLLERRVNEVEIEALVHQMYEGERLSPSLIMTALCRGHLDFVRAAIARLASIPTHNATKLLSDRGELGVRAIYTRTQMPESMYGAVSLLLGVAHDLEDAGIKPGTQAYANAAVERLMYHPHAKDVENLPYIMALIRQQPRA